MAGCTVQPVRFGYSTMYAVSFGNLVLTSRYSVTTQKTICSTAVRTSNLVTRRLDVLPNRQNLYRTAYDQPHSTWQPSCILCYGYVHGPSLTLLYRLKRKIKKFPYYSAQTKTLLPCHREQDTAHLAAKYASFPRGINCI
jgi:hypothetical protein